VKQHRRRQ